MFSEAISSISWRWRPSSPRMAAAISGSASASEAEKKESGAEAVLADELMKEYLHRRNPQGGCGRCYDGGRKSGASEIPHRAAMAKRLRLKANIYARCGGIP